MPKTRILVVDDEEGMLEVCAATLKRLPDTSVITEQDSRAATARLSEQNFDLLIADVCMPGLSGTQVLSQARESDPDLAVLMMTAFPSVETAVESMKLGAADYIIKPFLPENLLATVRRLLEGRQLRRENGLLRRQVDKGYTYGDIIGRSSVMRAVFDAIERIADTDVDVLILGETGTGKELVARSLHQQSVRNHGHFVPVDCGAIPEDLLESELFGHERGAYTGAHSRSLGLLEFADRGTFFMDEVAELPLRIQAKLLRTLQERRIRRVGASDEIDVDVRIVSATSRNLDEEVRQGRFRADLYYRINVARIELPPLRDRAEDLSLLTEQFAADYARQMGRSAAGVDPDVLEVFSGYPWPGNVRELQNVIKRAIAMARGTTLTVDDLPDEIVSHSRRPGSSKSGFFEMREQNTAHFEHDYLRNLLERCIGDVSRAAREAQIPRGTLYRLIKKYGLNPAEFRT